MKFSLVSVYLTLLLAVGFTIALPVISDVDGSTLAIRDVEDDFTDLVARNPVDYVDNVDLSERQFAAIAKGIVTGAKKVFGAIGNAIKKAKAKRRAKKAAKEAAKHAAQQHQQNHKRELDEVEDMELFEREPEIQELEDLLERYFDFDGEELDVRDVAEALLDDLEECTYVAYGYGESMGCRFSEFSKIDFHSPACLPPLVIAVDSFERLELGVAFTWKRRERPTLRAHHWRPLATANLKDRSRGVSYSSDNSDRLAHQGGSLLDTRVDAEPQDLCSRALHLRTRFDGPSSGMSTDQLHRRDEDLRSAGRALIVGLHGDNTSSDMLTSGYVSHYLCRSDMKFSLVAVYFTFLLAVGLAGARPVLNLEQRDECGLACTDAGLVSREAATAIAARSPSDLASTEPTDLTARFIGVAMKAAKIGVNIGKKIFGGIKKLFKKKHHKKKSAAKAAGKGGNEANKQHQQNKNNKKHKRALEEFDWEDFVERELEIEAADLYERSFDYDGDDIFVRDYDELLLEDLE
ncbi:hypothetical protein NMY22_g5118 [Coprinellus aureogranulatus]|nr:hypothetical protein NMY22_g5118 [Coprinellus aureogranulatus]